MSAIAKCQYIQECPAEPESESRRVLTHVIVSQIPKTFPIIEYSLSRSLFSCIQYTIRELEEWCFGSKKTPWKGGNLVVSATSVL
jgi:hypothetical protein